MPNDVHYSYGLTATAAGHLVVTSPERRGVISLWNSETGEHVEDLKRRIPNLGGRMRVAASCDGKLIAFGIRADSIRVHDRTSKSHVDLTRGHRPGSLAAIAFAPTGALLASSADDGRIVLWDTATGKQMNTIEAGPRGGVIAAIAWDYLGRSIVTLNGDGTVSVRKFEGENLVADAAF